MPERRVAVFCSASYSIDPQYNAIAREVIHELCACGCTIVSGGTVKGTMGAVAEAVVQAGGRHVGVLPRFMADVRHPSLTETVWTDTMAERKEKMREGTCAVIALPGGIGTLDELIETLTLSKLEQYSGRIFALNVNGFFQPLIRLLDYYAETGMLEARSRGLIRFPETVEELAGYFKNAQ